MAAPLSADRLVSALRAEGVRVVEVRSWRTHNRNHKGAWGPINGVMIHHTVTSGTDASVRICYDGYSSLPGPLCHGVIAKDGTVYLVGNGRANHAGGGDPRVLEQVVAESYGASPTEPTRGNYNGVDGNAHFYGFECINLGDGKDPWPEAQLDAIERAAAAICRTYGWSAKSVIGHKEWSSDKIDPRGFDMPWMRDRVAARLTHPASADSGAPQQEDDMPQFRFSGLAATKSMHLTPGDWHLMTWDREYQDTASDHGHNAKDFADGPCAISGVATLRFKGLPEGAQVQARVVELKDGEIVARRDPSEMNRTPGDTFLKLPFSENFRWERSAAIEVVYHAPDNSGDVTVTGAVQAHIWK